MEIPREDPRDARINPPAKPSPLAQGMLNEQVIQLVQKLLKMALDGDAKAMKLCIERILPPMKEPARAKANPTPNLGDIEGASLAGGA